MITNNQCELIRAWLNRLPGEDDRGDSFAHEWSEFARIEQPVVTLFGAYDTGKSALLRRLLVEAGLEVPEWVTISARHETYEINEVHIHGCLMRDTPGIVAGPTDVRAEANTALAHQALATTDIAIIVLAPQLATAERPALLGVTGQLWGAGGLWLVISRFDEAGVDPEGDLEGYRELADRKSAEVRKSLTVSDETPVFVVVPDFAQMAGFDRNPDPHIWDESRSWDGIDELGSALVAAAGAPIEPLRKDAQERFWENALASTRSELRLQLEQYDGAKAMAAEGLRRRESWLDQLDALLDAAEASIEGEVEEAIRYVMQGQQQDRAAIALSVTTALNLWADAQGRQLDRLAQDVDATTRSQHERPTWEALEDLISKLAAPESEPRTPHTRQPKVAPKLKSLGDSLLESLREYDKLRGKRPGQKPSSTSKPSSTRDGAPGGAAGSDSASPNRFGTGVDAATAAMPFLLELASAFKDWRNQHAVDEQRQQRRKSLEGEVSRIAHKAAVLAFDEWRPKADDLRLDILAATADQADLLPGLERLVNDLEESLGESDSLISPDDLSGVRASNEPNPAR